MAQKDYIPLWIALGSSFFGLLTTVADNLTRNLSIQIPVEQSVQSIPRVQSVQSVAKAQFNLLNWMIANPKIVIFASISIIGVVVFLIIKFKKQPRRKK